MILVAVLMTGGVANAYDDRVDDIMYQDPAFPEATERTEFADDLKPLWLKALARPESELQRMAADTIALAHRGGMPGLDDTADELLTLLTRDQLEPSVRRAIANALATLDAKQAAKPFAESMASGSLEMARIVEPALARWDYKPARSIWRQRLADAEIERSRLQLAIQCLGIIQDMDALSALLRIVKDGNAGVPVRLYAARTSAAINHSDLIATANDLATVEADQPTASLLAATLLTEQSGAETIAILKRLAAVNSVVTRGAALQRLFEIDPTHVYEFATSAIGSTDVNIRRVGSAALAHRADDDSIRQLAPLLDDPNPGLRRDVSDAMIRLGTQAPLRDVVIQTTTEIVSRDAWRGLEQSIIVLATIDHKPAAPRFVELLTHRRPEVLVTAAWGLRKLAVSDTSPAMLAHAEQQTKQVVEETCEPRYVGAIDVQLSHLFQALGELGYGEAEPLMRRFIPKTILYGGDSRPAAVWAIGKLNEGTVNEELAKLLGERLSDVTSLMPEVETVRRMSAIGIGRMKAESQLPALRRFVVEAPGNAGQACNWSLERMTGEVHDFSWEDVRSPGGWFLTPQRGKRPTETD
jgi:HEAT repeat protein